MHSPSAAVQQRAAVSLARARDPRCCGVLSQALWLACLPYMVVSAAGAHPEVVFCGCWAWHASGLHQLVCGAVCFHLPRHRLLHAVRVR